MTVLVAYATRHGSTAGIAQRIAAGLREAGITADARPVTEVADLQGYEAFVIGSAAYMFHWLKDATRFVKRHRARLDGRAGCSPAVPSGPTGSTSRATTSSRPHDPRSSTN